MLCRPSLAPTAGGRVPVTSLPPWTVPLPHTRRKADFSCQPHGNRAWKTPVAHATVAAGPPSLPPCGVHTRSHLRSQTRGPQARVGLRGVSTVPPATTVPVSAHRPAAPRGLPLLAHGQIFSNMLVSVQVPASRVRDRAAQQSHTSHICGSRRPIRKFLWVPRASTAPKRVAIKTGRLGRLRLPDSSTSSKATGTRLCRGSDTETRRDRAESRSGRARVQPAQLP